MRYSEVDVPDFSKYPERVLQFGEGNFLRAFVDWMIDTINENGRYRGSVVICQPIPKGLSDVMNEQHGRYHVVMRGIENGEPVQRVRLVTSVSRCINPYEDYQAFIDVARSADLQVVVSNTTEAGIRYDPSAHIGDGIPSSFPAKVTLLLYERYEAFAGDMDKGLLFLPVELIDDNGAELKRIVLRHAGEWNLGGDFIRWINEANEFTSTLVDRIVTGYPKDDIEYFDELLGCHDPLVDTCELFNLWVIQGDRKWMDVLPVHKGEGNVLWTEDVRPYKKRKVRILNGAHTSTVMASYLGGCDLVLDIMKDPDYSSFMQSLIFEEVIPTIDLPRDELTGFAYSVSDRFKNPFIKHKLLDISLNSCSKIEARCLPSLLDSHDRTGLIPKRLAFAFAAFIAFYRADRSANGSYEGVRENGDRYALQDSAENLAFFHRVWQNANPGDVVKAVLSRSQLWHGRDLTRIDGFLEIVTKYLEGILNDGVRETIRNL